ncbi:MAG: hypothetical protein A3F15_00130 [Candidatus Wildermuthbacteria bacterium RIFCSPHIGHO2_12_FULL_40_12]|uniref:ISXO2-like transposase domain-containing protein n=1 Tax=Candidatus Wildermuthbacteria bacterium RIFCSPHIGHO2_12_FULL_40_12 TaxID=1802457 RepID=A0A1G2RD19_9BACT|nr:MAG: hypothetical protein A3F15_00130 [Candidatus Wildermuthbacteria bacterium RIFCSPHIGHO2_12_FULL_40_12]
MKYTITQFRKDFPDDGACLEYLLKNRFPNLKCPLCSKTSFYKVKNTKKFSCSCGHIISPTANTIFHKSATSLTDWFFAIYLFSNSKNGVSSNELQRHLGCTYKTAWRIGHKIRSLMKQESGKLSGIVESDETYIGGRANQANKRKDKGIVMAMVQRKGNVKSVHIEDASTSSMLKVLRENVKFGSRVISDDHSAYKGNKVLRIGMFHSTIKHSKKEYVRGNVYTNTVEGFFSQFKRSLDGTYHSVSLKHLQSYADEFSFRYNHRSACFYELLYRLCGQQGLRGKRIEIFQGARVS